MSLYSRNGVWYVNISHPNHPRVRRSTGTTDRVEAQRIHDQIRADLWKQPVLTGRTWGDAVLLWAGRPGRSESDILSMRKFALHYPDRVITAVDRDSLLKALAFCKTTGTYMRYRGRITAILNVAKDEGWIQTVPKLPVRKDLIKPKPRKWLTPAEWERLVSELRPHMRAMVTFALETGLRQKNVLTLRWDQVDMDRGVVWYEANDMKARRAFSVPLSEGALMVLAEVKGQHPDFVFTYRGHPIGEIKTAFQSACVRAGVGHYNRDGHYEGFTWHGLRHTWATWHAQNGTPIDVLQQLGGWADPRMVANYRHHSPSHLARFADNVRKK